MVIILLHFLVEFLVWYASSNILNKINKSLIDANIKRYFL